MQIVHAAVRPPMEFPIETDPLDAALSALHPQGAFLFRSELGAPWGLTAPAGPASFHIVKAGGCWIETDGEAVYAEAGDLAVLPRGGEAVFRSAPGVPAPTVEAWLARSPPDAGGVLRNGAPGPETTLVCGGVVFGDEVPHPLLDALPPILVLRGALTDDEPWLASTLQFLACESRSGRPGATTVMGHLGSVVFVQAIRAAFAGGTLPGWLGALGDAHLGPALVAVQRAPERAWTVEAMGREANLGRSAFAARFRALVGEPPMRHLERWRAYHAARHLRAGATLAETAEAVGYESEAAFGRAFKRWTGRSPGSLRRAAVRLAA